MEHASCYRGGTGDRITAPLSGQDRRRKRYLKAQGDPAGRCWGRYVHVGKRETLSAADPGAKAKDGAPGIDGGTVAAIEQGGDEAFLEQIRDELCSRT